MLYFVIAEAVIVLATSCTSQITSRFMAASFERHMARSACENLLLTAQAALMLCCLFARLFQLGKRKEQRVGRWCRLNRLDFRSLKIDADNAFVGVQQ